MKLISNDAVSIGALCHADSWGSHRYVRREGSPGNYRYIYPEDINRATPKPSPKPMSSQASGAPAYDEAYRNYRDAISKYGKTFLGSIEGLLNTQYSKMQLSRASYGSGTVIPETVLKENIITETIIPEKKIYERRN